MSIELNVYRAINSIYDDTTLEVLEDSQALDAVYTMTSLFEYILKGEPTFEYEGLYEIARTKVNNLKKMVDYVEENE